MAVLALWTCWLMSLPIWSGMATVSVVVPPPDWFQKANPFLLVYAPYSWPGYVGPLDVALFVAGALADLGGTGRAGRSRRLRRAVLPVEAVRRGRGWRVLALSSRRPPMAGVAAGPVARRQSRAVARVASQPAVADGADHLGGLLAGLGRRAGDRDRIMRSSTGWTRPAAASC